MAQTSETKKALERDEFLCQWCLRYLGVQRNVFQYVPNYHSALGGGHHILRRNRVDDERAIISLCSEHHYNVENATREPTKDQLLDLMLEFYGYDLRKLWPEFIKLRSEKFKAKANRASGRSGGRNPRAGSNPAVATLNNPVLE